MLPAIEWRGACYLDIEEVLKSRRLSSNGRPVASIAHEALVAWLTNLLFGGFFKERYAAKICKAVETDGHAFRQALIGVAGKGWGGRLWQAAVEGHPEISAEWTRSLRLAVWWRAWFRSPVRTIRRFFAYVIAELRLRFAPPVPWVGILGSEGRGKSSLVNEISHRFAECPYGNVKAFHWHPRLTARVQSTEPAAEQDGRLPHRRPTGWSPSILGLAVDWLLVYWTRLVHLRAKGYIVSFDGMYLDLVVDANSRNGTRPRLARVLWWLLPKPDLVFVLAEPGPVRHWKQCVHVLDGSVPPSVLVDEVQSVIRSWMLDRSVASLGGSQASVFHTPASGAQGSTGAATLVSGGDGAR